jgi:hypothetical protein
MPRCFRDAGTHFTAIRYVYKNDCFPRQYRRMNLGIERNGGCHNAGSNAKGCFELKSKGVGAVTWARGLSMADARADDIGLGIPGLF